MKFSNIFLLSSIFLYSFIYATDTPNKTSKGVKSVEKFLESKQIDMKKTNKAELTGKPRNNPLEASILKRL